MLIKRDTL